MKTRAWCDACWDRDPCAACRKLNETLAANNRPDALPVAADLFPDLQPAPRMPRAGETRNLHFGEEPKP